jgi:hypothetical protein
LHGKGGLENALLFTLSFHLLVFLQGQEFAQPKKKPLCIHFCIDSSDWGGRLQP